MSTTTLTFTEEELSERKEELFDRAYVTCVTTTPLYGSQPADEKGIQGFVYSYLKLEGEEAESMIRKITEEELQSRRTGEEASIVDTTPPDGELDTKTTYGIKCMRRNGFGPYLGSWQLKACFKVGATSQDLYVQKRGSKAQTVEMGRFGPFHEDELVSLDGERTDPRDVNLFSDRAFTEPVLTSFERQRGCVSLAGSKRSIMVDAERVEPGAWFRFVFSWGRRSTKLSPDDVVSVIMAMSNIGLGSSRSFDAGKFNIVELKLEVQDGKGTKGKGKGK